MLNASYEPLAVVPLRRAVILVLAEKAEVVEAGDGRLHSERLTMDVPSVVRLRRYVRVPYRAKVPLSRRGVMARDGGRCAYCQGKAGTLDHVVPRSRGGLHDWTNVVAACARCNHVKADRLLTELGWKIHFAPAQPRGTVAVVVGYTSQHPSWDAYLREWGPTSTVSVAV